MDYILKGGFEFAGAVRSPICFFDTLVLSSDKTALIVGCGYPAYGGNHANRILHCLKNILARTHAARHNMDKQYPGVGIAVIVTKGDKVLVGKRREEYGRGTWAFPGGKLEFGETFEECVQRETREEAGVEIGDVSFAHVINDFMSDLNKHYVTIYMRANYVSGEPKAVDGEFEEWQWFDWESLPTPRFIPLENLVKSGYRPQL